MSSKQQEARISETRHTSAARKHVFTPKAGIHVRAPVRALREKVTWYPDMFSSNRPDKEASIRQGGQLPMPSHPTKVQLRQSGH